MKLTLQILVEFYLYSIALSFNLLVNFKKKKICLIFFEIKHFEQIRR